VNASQPRDGATVQHEERTAAQAAVALLQFGIAPGDSGRDAARQADPGLSRIRLFRGVIDAVAEARTAGLLAVIMDDLHWADADTLSQLSLARWTN
jgi:hypothetical protein